MSVVRIINLIKPNIRVVLENHRIIHRAKLPHRIMDAPSRDTIGKVVTLANTIVRNILNDQTDVGTEKLLLDEPGKSLSHFGDTLECLGSPRPRQKQVLGSLGNLGIPLQKDGVLAVVRGHKAELIKKGSHRQLVRSWIESFGLGTSLYTYFTQFQFSRLIYYEYSNIFTQMILHHFRQHIGLV